MNHVSFAALSLLVGLSLGGCSVFQHKSDPAPTEAVADSATDTHAALSKGTDLESENARMAKRIENLEEKVAMLNDKLSSAQTTIENISRFPKAKSTPLAKIPTDHAGELPANVDDKDETPRAQFTSNEAIEKFRAALILFDSGKYPEATLEFNAFLQSYPDHPFAGGAQFYIGESYYKQGELKLASDEYQRVLRSYDQSSYVSDALKRLSQCAEKMKQPKVAARNRQLLLSLFPQSPSAKEILEARSEPAPAPEALASPTKVTAPTNEKTAQPATDIPTAPVGEELPPPH